ncbi:hypothetical protein FQN49_007359 [Arthroderma sp. PD_2]|nr:hypothetical protein FQN49_007359 [Arthroderma sp. PD_2]
MYLKLPGLLYGKAVNSTVQTSTTFAPHDLMYGQPVNTQLSLLSKLLPRTQDFSCRIGATDALKWAAAYMKKTYDQHHLPITFVPGE